MGPRRGEDGDGEGAPLLAAAGSAGSGGGAGAGGSYGATRDGYRLSADGLADMVAHAQTGFLQAFGGPAALARELGCADTSAGLDGNFDFEAQRDKFGGNELELPPKPSLLALIKDGLKDVTILMLITSAVVSLVLGLGVERDFAHGWIEGVSILVTVAIVISVAALTDYAKAREFRQQQLDLDNQKSVQVIRNGTSEQIHPRELVVGDLVRLAVGDILPADGFLVEAAELRLDESALTGETNLVPKSTIDDASAASMSKSLSESMSASQDSHAEENGDAPKLAKQPSSNGRVAKADPFVVSGTNVMHGSGKMVVAAVGRNSMQGKILARLREQEKDRSADADDDEQELDKQFSSSGDLEEGGRCGSSCSPGECCRGFCSRIRDFFSFGTGDAGGDLMEKLDVLAVDIGKGGMIVATLVFMVMISRWVYSEWVASDEGTCAAASNKECAAMAACELGSDGCKRVWAAKDLSTVLKFFITAITILVVAVPEGLPLAVTLSLAVSMRRMTKDNNQVKHMDSCETMGSATTICSDKTGTLTENKMTVMRMRIGGEKFVYRAGSEHANIAEMLQSAEVSKAQLRVLCEGIILDSMPTSKVKLDSGTWQYEGNATECALLKLAGQLGYDAEALRKSYSEKESTNDWGVHSIPFSSERKRMSWVVRGKKIAPHGPEYCVYSKGAPQQILDLSTNIMTSDGSGEAVHTRDLTQEDREQIMSTMQDYQRNGMRTLALAYRGIEKPPKGGWAKHAEAVESKLTFVALFGIEDPLRQSVPGAIERCRRAGIDVRMCTGDALTTAVAIARQCGILRESDMGQDGTPKPNFAMTGAEFDERVHKKDSSKEMSVRRVYDPESGESKNAMAQPFLLDDQGNKVVDQAAFDELWPTLRVLARCQPEDKLTLVRGMRASKVFLDKSRCQELRRAHQIEIFPDYQVVAVTGDGTNDAPALKSADVGFAMGVVGTETAKQACDIILLDDNFSSIVRAVMWGRNVFDSISKFIQFQLTVNLVAITLAVVGAFTYNESPLSAVQMLWVNMIMDSLASLALATELPTEELLDRPPYGRRRSVISSTMMANIVGQGLYQLVVLSVVLFFPHLLPLTPEVRYEPRSGSVHWSLFFNVFVLLQLFNELNSRRLQNVDKLRSTWSEWNVFDGILSNRMFVGVVSSTFILQILIVQFGGVPVNLHSGGLTGQQWAASLIIGSFSLVWQLLINVGLVLWLPSTSKEEMELSKGTSERPSTLPKGESTAENWVMVRHHLRFGRVYSRAFGISLDSGVKLNSFVGSSTDTARRRKSMIAVARQISEATSPDGSWRSRTHTSIE